MKAKSLIKVAKKLATKHGATALTIFAALGVVATAVLTNEAKPQADERIQRAKEDKAIKEAEMKHTNPDFDHVTLTTVEKIRAALPAYVKVIVVAGITIVFIIGSRVISIKQVGDLAAAYNISHTIEEQCSKYADKYESKVKEIIGEEKNEEIKKEVEAEVVKDVHTGLVARDSNWIEEQVARAVHTGNGNILIYDPIIGRFFYSDPEHVRKIVNDINLEACGGFGMVSLNTFYENNDLPEVEAGESLYWDICGKDGNIDVTFEGSYDILDGRYPYLIMNFRTKPHGYGGKIYV